MDISEIISDVPLWNLVQLAPPPEIFLNYSAEELSAIRPLCAGVSVELGERLGTDLQALTNELHLLRSVSYRVGNQFSNCRAFRVVGAVSGCGRRLRQLADPGWLSGRVAALARPAGGSLPSRQMAQHLLVTCQRAGRLLSRLAELAERAARLWLQWLRLGHQAQLAVAFLGLLGRVWTLSGAVRGRLCQLFAAVRPLEGHLLATPVSWPHDPLPVCLWGWLGLPVGGGGAVVVPAGRGSSRAARRHDPSTPFEDQSREIVVSLLPVETGGCLQRTFAEPDPSEETNTCSSEAVVSSPRPTNDTTPIGTFGERAASGEPAHHEDLGELVDCSDIYNSPTLGDGDGEAALPGEETPPSGDGTVTEPATISDGDRKLYRRLVKVTRRWGSPEEVAEFVSEETAARKVKRKKCVTARLTQTQWKAVKRGLQDRCANWSQSQTEGDLVGEEKWAKRAKLFLKTWSMFPDCEGKKPADWAEFLEGVKEKRMPC
ncbi:uncharacterized protein LOC122386807 [Amphibalanus amphitrite]|uniref:uncharacterized protein LOC122386807 n=1 Tax=Amphibalanus amphitrite TaxID=1232801 RepID=UPI001C919A05|nr:uncharacterized protein LOC122386807 [Amphibalanus amphitrite]XP_043232379.1 uncharacterized protein LOC122386807 [Amphibalanus amphitrite]